MAKKDPGRELLDQVAACANNPENAESIKVFKKALASKYFPAAARAARAVKDGGLAQLANDIKKNFPRFMKNLPKS
ncbi:MAG: hypothetical protein JXR97_12665, partial [Planctomycetes bacterium]|nr:hypothetical protein [Planctomycetota bacterium]